MMPYIEGMLDGATKLQFEQHLNSCESCHEECKAIGRMQRVLQSAAPEAFEPAADLWARVNAQIQPTQPAQVSRSWWKTAPVFGAVAIVLIGIAIIPKYYQSSKQMMVATSSSSRDMLGGPGMKAMPGMPEMGREAPRMAPASPNGGAEMPAVIPQRDKRNIPALKLGRSKPAASVMMAKVPMAGSYSTVDRDALVEKEESRRLEPEVKLNVAPPILDSSILAKTHIEATQGLVKMSKAAPSQYSLSAGKDVANDKLNVSIPDLSTNTLTDNKLEVPQTFARVAKAAPMGAVTMPGGSGGAAMSESTDAVKLAPGMGGAAGMPGMTTTAAGKAKGDFSLYARAPAAADMSAHTTPTPNGMITALELQVKAGEKATAITLADKLHAMPKMDQQAWYSLGEMEEKLGRIPKALEAYRKSTDGADKEITRKAYEQIKRLEK